MLVDIIMCRTGAKTGLLGTKSKESERASRLPYAEQNYSDSNVDSLAAGEAIDNGKFFSRPGHVRSREETSHVQVLGI
ncbi:hypothetical protein GFL49_36900 [Rhizobium leguminosarum bv. viciae]|nr:hypothetical protein [Rhizobium leguminosarum bv. viciae]